MEENKQNIFFYSATIRPLNMPREYNQSCFQPKFSRFYKKAFGEKYILFVF